MTMPPPPNSTPEAGSVSDEIRSPPPNSTPEAASVSDEIRSLDRSDSGSGTEMVRRRLATAAMGPTSTRRSMDRSDSGSGTENRRHGLATRAINPMRNARRLMNHSHSESGSTTEDATNIVREAHFEYFSTVYKTVVNGDKEGSTSALQRKPPQGNFKEILHIAASAGQGELIGDILPHCKDVITSPNSKGDLPFHSAAKAGKLNALKSLTKWEVYGQEAENCKQLLGKGNKKGDTALHMAVKINQNDMAEYLVQQHCDACYQLNKKKVSPLYLAIKSGNWELAKYMINYSKELEQTSEDGLLKGKSVVHAAIEAKNTEVLKQLLETHPKLIQSVDEKGRGPLSYAAFIGFIEGVDYLFREYHNYAFIPDKDEDGSFPIHQAARGGHIKVIKKLYTSMHQLLNIKSQNILHVAAKSGKPDVVTYLLKMREFESLINRKDEDGNTPLHLATKGFHPRVVYILSRRKGIKLGVQNDDGLTALDLAEIETALNPTFEERLTWMALRYVNAPQSSHSTRKSFYKRKKRQSSRYKRKKNQSSDDEQESIDKNDKSSHEGFKDRIDTQILVATLVTTVTFAAGFTIPGGYSQSDKDPNIGMSVLVRKLAFQVFVICNTAALFSSILTVVTLIWAQLGELKLMLVAARFALLLLGFALTMMSVAFITGSFVVLRNLPWLSYVVLGLGSFFLILVLFFFIPLYNPSYIKNRVKRFFFTGIFLMLLQLCEKSTPKFA